MFEQFTDRARKVMALANHEAQRANHACICTEHILLGLLGEGTGVGVSVLNQFGVEPQKVRSEVEKLVAKGSRPKTKGTPDQSLLAKQVIASAIEESCRLKHKYIGTEHLLLGLLRVTDGVAAQVLQNLGLKLEDVREQVLDLLGTGSEPSDASHEPRIHTTYVHADQTTTVTEGGLGPREVIEAIDSMHRFVQFTLKLRTREAAVSGDARLEGEYRSIGEELETLVKRLTDLEDRRHRPQE